MAVSTELAPPDNEDAFEAMCCVLYASVFLDPGLMRVGRSGQSQFGVDLLGTDRRFGCARSTGVQCKHYLSTRFTLETVTTDVGKADRADLRIGHLIFATSARTSADVVRKVHELSEARRLSGRFTVSVEYWDAIQTHLRMHPKVGRAFIRDFPGSTILAIEEGVRQLGADAAKQSTQSEQGVEKTWAAQTSHETLVTSWSEDGIMEWTIKLEARTGWGEVTTCEIGALHRSLSDLAADGVGLSLAEAKVLLAELQQRLVQSQIDEYVTCARSARTA